MRGLGKLSSHPDWIHYYWNMTFSFGGDHQDYNELEDIQVFLFDVNILDKSIYPEIENWSKLRIWETAEGLIGYTAW
jgi:hypothetical protein